ncbi:hypothetical protein [Allocoleopsis franciscana]|uniref:DNA primase n=1 Tax=Allocoleopsis franciscana PCC 7113 TaxID=1173027 RepID=K9WQZ6_9CYAN|nr:hypothetical protein [Allocoleopsis franciscana]AFZ22204.1 hypothetical protein Mic7113_6636 [Allocoleopsis franciscana PCC 7113]
MTFRGGFRSLKRNCPICAGVRSDCRENRDNGLIHCRAPIATLPSGWRFVGEDKCGFGMYTQSTDNTDTQAWQERRQRQEQQRQRELEELARGALPSAERDTAIRKLHSYLGLGNRHRQNLRDRGLTDAAIDAGGFFTIYPDQELPYGIPANLPGVTRGKLATKVSGFACPAFDVHGRLIGWQLRVDDATDNKYRWAKGWKSSHLPNGELPITICRPVEGIKRPGVALAEGLLKPYVAAQKLGQIVIGAAGANFAGSPQQLRESLEVLKPEIITLYPDAGAVLNHHVMSQYQRTVKLIAGWGYSVQVAWWGQTIKLESPDIDELDDLGAIAYLKPAEFWQLAPSPRAARNFREMVTGWLPRIKQRLEASRKRLSAWGFGKTRETKLTQKSPKIEATEYAAGFRLDAWKKAAQEYKFIWDDSGTGSGKSFDAGRVTPELLECDSEALLRSADRVFYVTSDPRNPTTDTLADWGLLNGRHQGLVTDSHGKIRRSKPGESYTIQPNCYRVDTISSLREAGIEGADSSELICQTCPFYEACKGGHVFGYLNARMNALKLPRVRSHPASLPVTAGENAFDYSGSVLIWEEWNTILKNTRQITVTERDLEKLMLQLATTAPTHFFLLSPLLTALRQLIAGVIKQPNRFGWNHHALLRQLPELPADIDLEAIASVLEPDLEILDPTAEYGLSAAELPAGWRKKFTESDEATAEKIRTTLLKQWLMPFLRVLRGEKGYFTLSYGVLTITTPDNRLVDIAHAAKCNIFLDATGHREELALLLGIKPEEIYHIKQQQLPGAQVKRVQVAGLGRLGQHRGKEQQRRSQATVSELLKRHPNAGVIRFKRLALEGDYRWFIESRGVNDAQTLDTLILDGIPCENLEYLAAEFACIYGRVPVEGTSHVKTPVQLTNPLPEGIEAYFESSVSADPDFAEFVRRRILANIHQAEGRLRATRRQGEQLTVYILGDFALDVPVELVRATDITLEAASKTERLELAIRSAVEQLKATGQKVTQQAIANLAGYTRGHISRFQKLIVLLISDSKSEAIDNAPARSATIPKSPPDPPPDEIEWLSSEYLPLIADSPYVELLSLVDAYGKGGFNLIWNGATAEVQVKILSQAILSLLSGDELRQLARSVGVKL